MDELGYVAELSTAIEKAPKYGKNSKALILEAAQRLADEESAGYRFDQVATKDGSLAEGDVLAETSIDARKLDTKGLLEAVPKAEKPSVAYVAKAKVPRVNRQNVLVRLSAQHLALAVHEVLKGKPGGPQLVAQDTELRQRALQAAVVQELELYSQCGGQQVYLNKASRTQATTVYAHRRSDADAQLSPEAPVPLSSSEPAPDAPSTGFTTDAAQSHSLPSTQPPQLCQDILSQPDKHDAAVVSNPEEIELQLEGSPGSPGEAPANGNGGGGEGGEQGKDGSGPMGVTRVKRDRTESADVRPKAKRGAQWQAGGLVMVADDIDWAAPKPPDAQQGPGPEPMHVADTAGIGAEVVLDEKDGDAAKQAQQSQAAGPPAPKQAGPTTAIGGGLLSQLEDDEEEVDEAGAAECSAPDDPIIVSEVMASLAAEGIASQPTSGEPATVLPAAPEQDMMVSPVAAQRAMLEQDIPEAHKPADPPSHSQADDGHHSPHARASHSQRPHSERRSEGGQGQEDRHGHHGGARAGVAHGRGEEMEPISEAVRRFVKAILDPLWQSGALSKEAYKQVARRSVDKVVESHRNATSADFIATEGEKICKLVQQYVAYTKGKSL